MKPTQTLPIEGLANAQNQKIESKNYDETFFEFKTLYSFPWGRPIKKISN